MRPSIASFSGRSVSRETRLSLRPAVGHDDHRAGEDLGAAPGLADALGCIGLVGAPVGDDAADHVERDEQDQQSAGRASDARASRLSLGEERRRAVIVTRRWADWLPAWRRDVGHSIPQGMDDAVRCGRRSATRCSVCGVWCKCRPSRRQGRASARTPVHAARSWSSMTIRTSGDVVCWRCGGRATSRCRPTTGLQALELAARRRRRWWSWTSSMPELDGAEVCARLRAGQRRRRSSSSPPRTRRWTVSWAWSSAPTTMS